MKLKAMSVPTTLSPEFESDETLPVLTTATVPTLEEPFAEKGRAVSWGWLPVLSLVMALSLLGVAYGFNLARESSPWAVYPFIGGLIVMFASVAARVCSKGASGGERLGLVCILGLSLYLVKVLASPIAFTFNDEFIHWRTANDILNSQHLFSPNPAIPVSPLYPGLQIITAAFVNLAHLPIFESGVLVLALGRIILVASLFLLFKEISHSERIAGLGALFYMANPNFVYFSSQFAYESLALPLAVLVLYVQARRINEHGENKVGLNLIIGVGLIALVVSHHLTGFAMVGFLGLWVVVGFIHGNLEKIKSIYRAGRYLITRRGRNQDAASEIAVVTDQITWPGVAFLLMFVASIAWLVYVATFTVGYLAPVLQGAIVELIKLIGGETGGRTLFKGSTGVSSSIFEQLTGVAAVGLNMLMLPFGLFFLWKNQRNNILALTLGVAALAYPATLALRFTVAGWEVANRTSEFIFIPLGYVLAIGMARLWLELRPLLVWRFLSVLVLTVVFMGGMLVGWPPYARMPGPYLVEADTRSVQKESVEASNWVLANLGAGNRIASDRLNNLLLISYGDQYGIMNVSEKVNVGAIFIDPELGPLEIDALKRGKIRYVIVDRRLSTGLPMVGIYFEAGEPNTNNHKTPVDPAALAKFEKEPLVKKVYESENIAIYDVGALSGVS